MPLTRCALLTLWLGLLTTGAPAPAQEPDPLALQRQALARLDAYVDHFRKTGDVQTLRPEAVLAAAELVESNRLLRAGGDSPQLALGLFKLGRARRTLGEFAAAESAFEQAQQVAGRLGLGARQASALAGRASTQAARHQYGDAYANAARAVQLAEATQDNDALADALDALGSVQIAQGDLAGASETLTRQVAAAGAASDPNTLYYAYNNRADLYVKRAERCDYDLDFQTCLRSLDAARADYEAMLGLVRRLGHDGLARMVEDLVANLENRRMLIRMRESQLAGIADAPTFHPHNPGDVLVSGQFRTSGPADAETRALVDLFQAAGRDHAQRFGPFADADSVASLHALGVSLNLQGQSDAALEAFHRALDAIERDLGSFTDERSRARFLDRQRQTYDDVALHLLQRGRHAEAFAVLERARSRALADLLASRTPGIGMPAEQALFAEAADLRAQISQAQARWFATHAPAGSDAGAALAAARDLDASLAPDKAHYQALLDRMQAQAPRLARLVQSRPATLGELQASMRAEGYEVLYYTATDSGLILWHISADDVFVRNVFLPRQVLAFKAAALRASLRDPGAPFADDVAGELFLYLIQPVLARVHGEHLVIIPPEDLADLPFQALRDSADGRWLGDRMAISYAPSATVLLGLPPAKALGDARVVALADPELAAAPAEVQAIGALFPGRSRVEWAALPQEGQVADLVSGYDVVHFAVHGKFVPLEPMLSYLQLAPDGLGGGNDGRLTAAELFGLPLGQARLVTLSACESGRAQSTHANEQLGLARALLYAGAGALLLSQWEVDTEASAAWMRAFYAAARSRPLPEAARTAALAVRQDPATAHPFYWAAFTLLAR